MIIEKAAAGDAGTKGDAVADEAFLEHNQPCSLDNKNFEMKNWLVTNSPNIKYFCVKKAGLDEVFESLHLFF